MINFRRSHCNKMHVLQVTHTARRYRLHVEGHNALQIMDPGKSSESVQCAITGPCLRMRHRPLA